MSSKFGKYRLVAELGHGGMADVYLAAYQGSVESQGFNKLLVIKRLRANLADEEEFVSMLLDEGRLAARLNHPNVVQTYEIGEQEGRYFIAMEYLDGQPLHRIMNRGKAKGSPMTIGMGIAILVDVLAGLHNAHELLDFDGTRLGVVHRDISPQNVFLTYAGQVKVVDFGIAKALGRSAETREGVIKGKITYMAPEQVMGSKEIDRRADVFAVGVMLWEQIVGDRMWKGLQDVDIVQHLLSGNYPRHPRDVKADIPEELDRICAKALEPKKEDRYETALDFQNDLEAYLRATGQHVSGRDVGKYVSELFADKQAEVKRVIEAQLKRLATESPRSEHSMADLGPTSGAVSINNSDSFSKAVPQVAATDRDRGGGALSETMMGTVAGPVGTKKRSKWAYVAVAAGASVALTIVAFGAKNQKVVGETSETAASSAGPLPPLPARVDIILRAEPSEARFSIDDGPVLENPYVSTVPRDSSTHIVRIRATGYKDRAKEVTFAQNVVVDVMLERDPRMVPVSAVTPPVRTGGGGGGGGGGTRGDGPKKRTLDPL